MTSLAPIDAGLAARDDSSIRSLGMPATVAFGHAAHRSTSSITFRAWVASEWVSAST